LYGDRQGPAVWENIQLAGMKERWKGDRRKVDDDVDKASRATHVLNGSKKKGESYGQRKLYSRERNRSNLGKRGGGTGGTGHRSDGLKER